MIKKNTFISLVLLFSLQKLLYSQNPVAQQLYNKAVISLDLEKLQKYRTLGVDLNSYEQEKTTLALAIKTGNIDVVKEVVEYGKADVNIPSQYKVKKFNRYGGRFGNGGYEFVTTKKYPIQYAVEEKKYDIVEYLIDKGANKNLIIDEIKLLGRMDLVERFQIKDKLRFSTAELNKLLQYNRGGLSYLGMAIQNGARPDVWSAIYAIRSTRNTKEKLELLHKAGLSLQKTYARTGKGLAWGTICECFERNDISTLKLLAEEYEAPITGYCTRNGVNKTYTQFLKEKRASIANPFQEYLLFAPSIIAKKKAERQEKANLFRKRAVNALENDSLQLAYDSYQKAYELTKDRGDKKQQALLLMQAGESDYEEAYKHFSYAGLLSKVLASLDDAILCDLGKYMLGKKDERKAYNVLFAKTNGGVELTYYQSAYYAQNNNEKDLYKHLKILKEKGFTDTKKLMDDKLFVNFQGEKKFMKFAHSL